jgi:hypothetical protein
MTRIPSRYTHETIAMGFNITEVKFWFPDTIRVPPPDRPKISARRPRWLDINGDHDGEWQISRLGVWTW